MAEDVSQAFARVRAFDWDPEKRKSNLRDKKIDFVDVRRIFDGPTFIRRSDRHGEIRYQVFGHLNRREIAVVCTIRGTDDEICWVISARRANRSERRKYYPDLARRSSTRQD